MKGYYLDAHPQANVANEHFAVVNMPRLKRDRCPETNVQLVESKELAIQEAQGGEHLHAARVIGPARSSEGFNLFYIIEVFD